jgi:hypothetical protein
LARGARYRRGRSQTDWTLVGTSPAMRALGSARRTAERPLIRAFRGLGLGQAAMRYRDQEALDVGAALRHPVLPIFGMKPGELRLSNRLVETMLDKLLAGFTLPHTKSTVLQDWMKGRRSEVDDLNGLGRCEGCSARPYGSRQHGHRRDGAPRRARQNQTGSGESLRVAGFNSATSHWL